MLWKLHFLTTISVNKYKLKSFLCILFHLAEILPKEYEIFQFETVAMPRWKLFKNGRHSRCIYLTVNVFVIKTCKYAFYKLLVSLSMLWIACDHLEIILTMRDWNQLSSSFVNFQTLAITAVYCASCSWW